MSKNASLEKLGQELPVIAGFLDDSLLEDNNSIILARVLKGVSSVKWQHLCKENGLTDWYAIPVANEDGEWSDNMEVGNGTTVPVTPFVEIQGIITRGMFRQVLDKELKRLNRSGGSLSLLSVGLVNLSALKKNYGEEILSHCEAALANIFISLMDICDSIGILRKGQFMCCLPGIGQLAARHLAEKAQNEFLNKIPELLPEPSKEGPPVECAIGIVNLLQGEDNGVLPLINRSSLALEMAFSRGNHIYQESTSMPFENTTLVQSSEKQFLFFGSSKS